MAALTRTTTTKNRQNLDFLLAILRRLQAIDPEFPLHYATCLIEIALDEGLSLTLLSQRTGLTISSISRIIGALSDNRSNGKAYGLVHVKVSVDERRRKELSLTPKGRAVIADLEHVAARAA